MTQQETVDKGSAEQKAFEKRMRPAWRGFLVWWLVAAVLAALAIYAISSHNAPWWTIGVALIPVLYIALQRCSVEFIIKNDEVTFEKGIVSKQSVEIGMQQIRSIEVRQTVFQRMMGVGDLLVASSGTSAYEIIVPSIEEPKENRDLIQGFQRGTINSETAS
ncbi:MAG: PH domain-containing protein [Synergistota bacterium]|nr:PH domain-containing protein [Synergistota bacterium]